MSIFKSVTPKRLESLELFTGAGGLALGSQMAGFQHTGLFEFNSEACETLRLNSRTNSIRGVPKWRDVLTQDDIRNVRFDTHEGVSLVAGGPPCQPFSLGGKHRGMEDKRDMIPQFIRAVRDVKPRAFILENVRGLTRKAFSSYLSFTLLQLQYPDITRKQGETWEEHFARLQQHHTSSSKPEGLTYNVLWKVLNAADYGVPQVRERIFIVGFRSDIDAQWHFPKPTHSQDALLYRQWISGEYWDHMGIKTPKRPKRLTSRLARLEATEPSSLLLPWKTVREAISGLPAPFKNESARGSVFNHRFQPGARPYPGHTGSPIDWPAKTLKAGAHGVPGGENMIAWRNGTYRYLTVREAARIQTFPDTWVFTGAWSEAMRQLGNAVPVNLAHAVAQSVADTLLTHPG